LIRLFEPNIDDNEVNAVINVLKSGNWASGSGEGLVRKFELELAEYTGFNNVIAVNSGTSALHLALSMYDIEDKEVILPALSFVSTANAILYNGGIPVFADVLEDTLCLDPKDVDKKFTDNTACIMPVNFGGLECPEYYYHDTPIVCDSAHRIERGANNDMTCYSFHPIKNLATISGGAIAFNGNLDKLKARRWCGITNRNGDDYEVKELGYNYYMNQISAVMGIEQLKKLGEMGRKRVDIARRYNNRLNMKHMPFDINCSYHLFWILVDDREKFRKKMYAEGIETGTHYKPIDQFSLYKKGDTPVTDRIWHKIVTLPIHTKLTDQDVDLVIKCANS